MSPISIMANFILRLISSLIYTFIQRRSPPRHRATQLNGALERLEIRAVLSGTGLLKDINPGTASSDALEYVQLGATTYFVATDAANGNELWKTDGTEGGTILVKDITPGAASSTPRNLVEMGGNLYFVASDGTNGRELWRSDGTAAGTVLVKDIRSGTAGSNIEELTTLGEKLIFTANNLTNGSEVWVSDGTSSGTFMTRDISPSNNIPSGLTKVGNQVFFIHTDGTTGTELYKTDGTSAGTVRVKDINVQPVAGGSAGTNNGSLPRFLTNVGGVLYFSANGGSNSFGSLGTELWRSDGTEAGTVLVKDILTNGGSSNPQFLTNLGGVLYFTASYISGSQVFGSELWKSDGTDSGTVLVKDILPGSVSSNPSSLTAVGDALFFTANNGSIGTELWISYGTEGGTAHVRDILPGSNSSNPANLINNNGVLYFTANDGTNGVELWRSDGSVSGTTLALDIVPGAGSSSPTNLRRLGDKLFFTANDGIYGAEPWIVQDNNPPSNIGLTATTVEENVPIGTTVGLLSATDPNPGSGIVYSLVDGSGGTDNANFVISGNSLNTAAAVNFEAKSYFTIRVRATDGGGLFSDRFFDISVTDINEAPAKIEFSLFYGLPENAGIGTSVGFLSATDPDSGDSSRVSFSLVAGAGADDNVAFSIDNSLNGYLLKTAATVDFESQSSYRIRVRGTDSRGAAFEQPLVINAINVNEAPTSISLSGNAVAENLSDTKFGVFSAADPENEIDAIFLVSGEGSDDNHRFQITYEYAVSLGTYVHAIKTLGALDFESQSLYRIRVRVRDLGGLFIERQFIINVTDDNDRPTNISLSNSTVDEHRPLGTTVGVLSTTDQDAGDTFAYELRGFFGSYPDTQRFTLDGNVLKTAAVFDYQTKSTYQVEVATFDAAGRVFTKVLTISVNNVNESPTDLALTNNLVVENVASGTVIGIFSATDPDAGDSFTFDLVDGQAFPDNSAFRIDAGTLKTVAVPDYETQRTYSIRVRATDAGGNSVAKSLTILVTNVLEVPSQISLSNARIAENAPSGTVVGSFLASDVEPGDNVRYSLVPGIADNAPFSISGTELKMVDVLNHEVKSLYNVRVRVTNSLLQFADRTFAITVTNVNEVPTDITLSNATVQENTPLGFAITGLSAKDPDLNESYTYSLVSGPGLDSTSFAIDNNALRVAASLDFETQSSYAIRIRVRDAGGLTFDKSFTITVQDIANEPYIAGAFGWALVTGGSGYDVGNDLVTDANGNVYVTGSFRGSVDFDLGPQVTLLSSVGDSDVFVAKYSSTGNLLWAKSMGGTSYDSATGIVLDGVGNVFTIGSFEGTADFNPHPTSVFNLTSAGGTDGFVGKLSSNGDFIWAKSMRGQANGIAVDSAGSVFTTGYFTGTADFNPHPNKVFNLTSAGGSDIFVSKLGSNGDFLWAKSMGGTESDSAAGIAIDKSGNVYTTGRFSGTADFNPHSTNAFNLTAPSSSSGLFGRSVFRTNVFVSKLSASGDFVWAKSIGGTESDSATGIAIDNSGNVYTTGSFGGTVDFNPHPTDAFNLSSAGGNGVFVNKLTSNGDFAWAKSMGGTSSIDVAVDSVGNVYTTGYFSGTVDFNPHPTSVLKLSSAGESDVFVNKLTSNGDFAWAKSTGGTSFDYPGGIAVDSNGNVYTTGELYGTADFDPHPVNVANLRSSGDLDIFVSKLSQAFLNGGGTAQNGYLVGSTAFFDANFNGVLDSSEPNTVTDSTGAFAVEVPLIFDINVNGLLDDTEGQWVVFGGTDSSTGLSAVNTLISPASWSVVTPLTTLVSTLVANHGYTVNGAMSRVNEALGLPALDLSDLLPISSTLAGDPNAPQVFAAHARIQDTISQALAVFAGVGTPPVGVDFSRILMAEIASLIAIPAATPDFSDVATIEQLLHSAETTSGVALDIDVLNGASSVIAETNQLIDDVAVVSNLDFLNQISQIKRVSQGSVASQLKSASRGDVDIATVVAENTGVELLNQVAAAETPPTLILPANIFAEATSAAGAEVSFTVSATNLAGQAVPVVINYHSGDLFGFGTTTVTVSASGGGVTSSGSFTVTVADTVGPQIEAIQDIVIKSNTPGGAMVTLNMPTATDLVDPNPEIVWDAESGFFPLGTSTITVTATDETGNSTILQYLVIVTEANEAPDLSLQDVVSSLSENTDTGSRIRVAEIVVTDDDLGANTLSLSGADAAFFEIVGTQLFLKAGVALDFETQSSLDVSVHVDDVSVPDNDISGAADREDLTVFLLNVLELRSFDVQKSATQRSFIRNVDFVFDDAASLQSLIGAGRIQLTRASLDGLNPSTVSLSGKLTQNQGQLSVDFGIQGIGGNRNNNVGDGYYQFKLDMDGNGSFETTRSFYRLFGDTNGDRQVTDLDVTAINAVMGSLGSNLNQDINGDGIVNAQDRGYAMVGKGRRLANGLWIDD